MDLLLVKEASKISRIPERTIRDWMKEGNLQSFKNDDNVICVERRQLLSSIPTVLTVFNQKGGCGKTSLSVLVADYYEKKNMKVLLVDFDQQGNLTQTYFAYDELKDSLSLYDYFENRTPLAKIIRTYNDTIDILPSNIKLSRFDKYDIDDLDAMRRDFAPIFKKYQMVIIDCPPSLNSFSKFGLILSNYVLIPVIPEPYNYDGLYEVMNTIKRLQKFIEGFIDYKVVISAHEQRTIRIHENYIELIREEIGGKVAEQSIPNFVGIKERSFQKMNIFDMYDTDKSMQKIAALLDELDASIYDKRGM
ncbi:MAG TPA: AAA family ATPase [Spirochaetota bacterium]|nr:AAA family ATPase [Spirochaetota bacterium]HNT12967.1 AAA family ATPase [Spirochaetota bacterium]